MIEAVGTKQWAVGSFDNRFFEEFNDEFDALAEVLSKGLLASYLLAGYQVKAETQGGRAEFAEGDDPQQDEGADAAQAQTMTAGPVNLRFNVPPDEAIDYFKSKRIVTRKVFDKLADDARASAFTVSGIYKQDVLGGFKSEIAKSLEQGTPQSTVIKRFKEILNGAGHKQLGNMHLENIFRTNSAMAYGTGRRRALEEVADDLPYWQYHAVMDDRVRPTHAALNNLVLPANHPFWTDHYPPWGFS